MPDAVVTKLLPAGALAPDSGIYEQIGPGGRTGIRIRLMRGAALPSTALPQNAWELISEERPVPEMQVITKGGWRLKRERASVEELEQEDRHEQQQA